MVGDKKQGESLSERILIPDRVYSCIGKRQGLGKFSEAKIQPAQSPIRANVSLALKQNLASYHSESPLGPYERRRNRASMSLLLSISPYGRTCIEWKPEEWYDFENTSFGIFERVEQSGWPVGRARKGLLTLFICFRVVSGQTVVRYPGSERAKK